MLIYAKMAKNCTFFAQTGQKINFSKNVAQCFYSNSQGTSDPNFSSKDPVEFSNCGGKCRKMKFVKMTKM